MLAIDRSKIDGKNHLLYDDNGNFSFVDTIPKGCFILGTDSCRSIKNMAKLLRWDLPELVPDNFLKMADTLGAVSPNWIHLVGKPKFFTQLKAFFAAYEAIKKSYNPAVVKLQTKLECLIRMMNPAPYDIEKVPKDSMARFEKSLRPHYNDGQITAPSYIRTHTKTGRLTVKSGPPVLTMHANLRKGLVDAIQIDFRSMEPNLLLAWQGRPTYLDLYSALAEEVFDGKLSRTKVKLSVIASLYNSERSNKHAKAIAEFFKVKHREFFLSFKPYCHCKSLAKPCCVNCK